MLMQPVRCAHGSCCEAIIGDRYPEGRLRSLTIRRSRQETVASSEQYRAHAAVVFVKFTPARISKEEMLATADSRYLNGLLLR